MTCENNPPAAARWGGSFNPGGVMTSEAPELSAQRVNAVPAGLVHDDEIVILLLRPSLLFIPLACLSSVTLIAIVTLALALLATKLSSWIPWEDTHAYALGAVLAAARLAWQALDWWGRLFVLTDRRIIRRMGVLHISAFEAPLKNIQHTSVFRLMRERLFGLGTIGFATAGSDVFDAFWMMVRQPFAVHRVVVEAIHRYGGR